MDIPSFLPPSIPHSSFHHSLTPSLYLHHSLSHPSPSPPFPPSITSIPPPPSLTPFLHYSLPPFLTPSLPSPLPLSLLHSLSLSLPSLLPFSLPPNNDLYAVSSPVPLDLSAIPKLAPSLGLQHGHNRRDLAARSTFKRRPASTKDTLLLDTGEEERMGTQRVSLSGRRRNTTPARVRIVYVWWRCICDGEEVRGGVCVVGKE